MKILPAVLLALLLGFTAVAQDQPPLSSDPGEDTNGGADEREPQIEIKVRTADHFVSSGDSYFPPWVYDRSIEHTVIPAMFMSCDIPKEVLEIAPIDAGGLMERCSLSTAVSPLPPKIPNMISTYLYCEGSGDAPFERGKLFCRSHTQLLPPPPIIEISGEYFEPGLHGPEHKLHGNACGAYIRAAADRCKRFAPR